jgi:hypothetical protein
MFHVRAPKRLIVGMLALALGLLVVQSATAATAPIVIPYLSHGIGVDQSLYSGQSHQLRRTSSTRRVDPGPDAFMRAVARHQASLSQSANLNTYNYERVVAQAEAVKSQAFRPDDRAGVHGIESATYTPSTQSTESPEVAVARAEAVQSQTVRPDDRAGPLGIGGSSGSTQSSVSSSSTDWNTILFAAGAVLATMLLAGWAIQFGRRQSGRIVTH